MTVTTEPTRLSVLIREGSKSEHEAAEGSTFTTRLLDGQVDAAGYAHYLATLRPVYAALESIGRELASDPMVSAVVDPGLERVAAIDADLDHWTEGAGIEVISPASDAYVARIEATRADPKLFIAHHYTRYLGDLSGGQAIGRILSRTYGLESVDGVRFYDFPGIARPKIFKDGYRARLDALPLDEEEQQAVLAEVQQVFGLNGALFAELSRTVLGQD